MSIISVFSTNSMICDTPRPDLAADPLALTRRHPEWSDLLAEPDS